MSSSNENCLVFRHKLHKCLHIWQQEFTDVLKRLLIFTNKTDFKFFLESYYSFYLLKDFWRSVPGNWDQYKIQFVATLYVCEIMMLFHFGFLYLISVQDCIYAPWLIYTCVYIIHIQRCPQIWVIDISWRAEMYKHCLRRLQCII